MTRTFRGDRAGADTLASIDRIERIVIQHAPEDFAALPRFPAYLE